MLKTELEFNNLPSNIKFKIRCTYILGVIFFQFILKCKKNVLHILYIKKMYC